MRGRPAVGAHGRRKFQLLKTFPNVLITPHSAFLTREALANIAAATVANLQARRARPCACMARRPLGIARHAPQRAGVRGGPGDAQRAEGHAALRTGRNTVIFYRLTIVQGTAVVRGLLWVPHVRLRPPARQYTTC